MSKLRVTFTFTDHVDIDLADYVGETMPDSRAIEIAREILASNYDALGMQARVHGAYLLLGDAGADIETVNDWGRE